jgi:hypothetical protein
MGMELKGTHQLLVYVDNVNIVGENKSTLKKNKEALLQASKEASLEINAEKPTSMFMPHHQNEGQNHSLMTANKPFKNVAKLKYLGMTTNQNYIHEEIKSRLNLGNACYNSVQNLLSFFLFF